MVNLWTLHAEHLGSIQLQITTIFYLGWEISWHTHACNAHKRLKQAIKMVYATIVMNLKRFQYPDNKTECLIYNSLDELLLSRQLPFSFPWWQACTHKLLLLLDECCVKFRSDLDHLGPDRPDLWVVGGLILEGQIKIAIQWSKLVLWRQGGSRSP